MKSRCFHQLFSRNVLPMSASMPTNTEIYISVSVVKHMLELLSTGLWFRPPQTTDHGHLLKMDGDGRRTKDHLKFENVDGGG